ncbi:MAG: M23 family metallopeptidase [Deltaproteobacteria bacterium]|nr:MAG: M23 family metallopeptidase [Deltaproteobacteria bacterium]
MSRAGAVAAVAHRGGGVEEGVVQVVRDGLEVVLTGAGMTLDQEVRIQLSLAGLDEVLWRMDGGGAEERQAGTATVTRRVRRVEAEVVPDRRLRRVEVQGVPSRRLARVEAHGVEERRVRAVTADRGDGAGGERWMNPMERPRVTSRFGPRIHPITGERGRMHNGLDFGAATGTPVLASATGEVLLAGWCGNGPGNCVVIDHGGGWRSHYFHLSRWRVRAGQRVHQGERIGDVGSTGASTGPHLHFEIRRDGRALDPEALLGRAVGR